MWWPHSFLNRSQVTTQRSARLIRDFNVSYSSDCLVKSHGGFTLRFLDEK